MYVLCLVRQLNEMQDSQSATILPTQIHIVPYVISCGKIVTTLTRKWEVTVFGNCITVNHVY